VQQKNSQEIKGFLSLKYIVWTLHNRCIMIEGVEARLGSAAIQRDRDLAGDIRYLISDA
jgi:hypothetical protein